MTYDLNEPGDPAAVLDETWRGRMRRHRDRLLVESDWTQVADAPVNRQAWADYRQALRDLPATWTPGPTVEFPPPPA